MTEAKVVRDFLEQKRIAFVGVSRQPKDISRALFREFERRGYDLVPVHPEASDIEGRPCFASLRDIQPPVDGALLMTSPGVTDRVVRDCVDAGVKRVWMFRGGGKGAVTPEAVKTCESNGIAVVAGECPFMFLPGSGFIHGLHGFVKKITGSYPK
jgi:predicted CoA-binding protein